MNETVGKTTNRKGKLSTKRGNSNLFPKKMRKKKQGGQQGGAGTYGHCSYCGSPGVNQATCPRNPDALNTKPRKHL